MIREPDRIDKKGRTILEETDILNLEEYFSDTLVLEEEFTDMQVLICTILQELPSTPLDNETIGCIYTLEQVCTTILEKINTKLQ